MPPPYGRRHNKLRSIDQQLKRLQSVQNAAARLVTGTRRSDHIIPVLKVLHWLPVRQRIQYKMAMLLLVHKCLNERAPEYLITDCCWAGSRRSGARSAGRQMLEVVRMNTSFGDRSFAAAAPRVWNSLPDVVRHSALSEDTFAKLLKTYLINCVGRGAFDVELAPYEINLLLLSSSIHSFKRRVSDNYYTAR